MDQVMEMLLHAVVVLVVVLEEVKIQQLQVVTEIRMAKARLLDILVLHMTPLSQVLVRVDGPQVVEAVVAALHQYLHPQEVPLVVSDCRFLLLDRQLPHNQWGHLDQVEELDGLQVVVEEMLLMADTPMVGHHEL